MKVRFVAAAVLPLLVWSAGCHREDSSTAVVSVATEFPMPPSADASPYEFEAPVRVMAGDEFVSVESPGYACPTMADVDGDGKQDLVVGQFRQGHMQLCKNVSADGESPRFSAPVWIESGGERAVVPGVW